MFETVTYMIDGVYRHQDSNGGGGLSPTATPSG
jgi:redox-sensitive bicupin YhaK (pirin superfamily)